MTTTSNDQDSTRGALLLSDLTFEKAPQKSVPQQPARQRADDSALRQLQKQQAQAQGQQMD